jgi:hypothetical protein
MNKIVLIIVGLLVIAGIITIAIQLDKDKNIPVDMQETSQINRDKVIKILENFDANKLTHDDILAIHRLFRVEGLLGCPELDEIITNAGFNQEMLCELTLPHNIDKQSPHDRQNKSDKHPGSRPLTSSGLSLGVQDEN